MRTALRFGAKSEFLGFAVCLRVPKSLMRCYVCLKQVLLSLIVPVLRLLQDLELPAGFETISLPEEEALVVRAVAPEGELLNLFRAYGTKDLLTFVRFARAVAGTGVV